jgi:preprotein translocase subunit SecD
MKKTSQVMCALILIATIYATTMVYDFREGKSKMLLGLDLRSGSHIAVELLGTGADNKPVTITKEIQAQAIQVFRKRLDPEGNKEVVIAPEDVNRLIIEIPEVTDLSEAEKMVRRAGRLEFKASNYDPSTGQLAWTTRLDGSAVKSAQAMVDPTSPTENWQIDFTLTSEGAKAFGSLTRELIGRPLGIFFDGEEISAPNVNSPITGGHGTITGSFTKDEALSLSNYLNAGALPVNVKILESYTVSPTLGAESLLSSVRAGAVGILVVAVFMTLYYRLLGILAGLALMVYTVAVLASMNIPTMQFVLTLPGIAGFILSIGMAVDANVLIFERIREERERGRTLTESIDTGFNKAFSSILDGHVTTFLGAAILFALGSANIKGFGLTLMLGTAWSMITAIVVTKNFLLFTYHTLGVQSPKAYGKG